MKFKIRNLIFVLALIFTFCCFGIFAACGDKNTENNNDLSSENSKNYGTLKSVSLSKDNYSEYLLIEYNLTFEKASNNNDSVFIIAYNVTVRPIDSRYKFENCILTIQDKERKLDTSGIAHFSYATRETVYSSYTDTPPKVTAASGTISYYS